MKLFLIIFYFIKCIQSQQEQDIGSFYQPQLPFIRASIPLIRQLSGNLPGIDRFTQNLERLQRITPDDIRASEARERERELNPPTTPVYQIIEPVAPAERRPSFKYPEIKNSLNGPNALLKNVRIPYGDGLNVQNYYG